MDRYAADRTVKRLARRAGITKRISPHSLRHPFITAALDAGVPLRDVQEAASHADPRTTMRSRQGPGVARPPRHLHRGDVPRWRPSLKVSTRASYTGHWERSLPPDIAAEVVSWTRGAGSLVLLLQRSAR